MIAANELLTEQLAIAERKSQDNAELHERVEALNAELGEANQRLGRFSAMEDIIRDL